MKELEQMREQLALLRSKLDSQAIINDRLLRRSMQERMTWVKRYSLFQLLCLLPFIYICFAFATIGLHLPWALYIYICVMCTVSALYDIWVNNYLLPRNAFQASTLLELAQKLERQKRLRSRGELAGIPLLTLLIVWLGYEYYMRLPAPLNISALVCTLIGAAVGICIGVYVFLRMQRTNDELLKEIEHIKSLEEEE